MPVGFVLGLCFVIWLRLCSLAVILLMKRAGSGQEISVLIATASSEGPGVCVHMRRHACAFLLVYINLDVDEEHAFS